MPAHGNSMNENLDSWETPKKSAETRTCDLEVPHPKHMPSRMDWTVNLDSWETPKKSAETHNGELEAP